jgi:hypothetical protein
LGKGLPEDAKANYFAFFFLPLAFFAKGIGAFAFLAM